MWWWAEQVPAYQLRDASEQTPKKAGRRTRRKNAAGRESSTWWAYSVQEEKKGKKKKKKTQKEATRARQPAEFGSLSAAVKQRTGDRFDSLCDEPRQEAISLDAVRTYGLVRAAFRGRDLNTCVIQALLLDPDTGHYISGCSDVFFQLRNMTCLLP